MATATKQKKYFTANDLTDLIATKFSKPTYACFRNVANGTGTNISNRADAIAVGCWPSRGLSLDGFEVKISRSDWLRELKMPHKAEAFAPYCDRWWIVVGNAEIVKLDEMPEGWGLMAARGGGLGVVREAVKNASPVPVDRHLLAAICRKAADNDIEASALAEAETRGRSDARKEWERTFNALKDKLGEKEQQIIDFERASGLNIRRGDAADLKRFAEAVRIVMDQPASVLERPHRELKWMVSHAESLLSITQKQLAAVEAVICPSTDDKAEKSA